MRSLPVQVAYAAPFSPELLGPGFPRRNRYSYRIHKLETAAQQTYTVPPLFVLSLIVFVAFALWVVCAVRWYGTTDKPAAQLAIPVHLSADGMTKQMYTTEYTVENALKQLQIEVGAYDRVTPALNAPLHADTSIHITRVNMKTETISEPIPYNTIRKDDPNLLEGKEKVLQAGEEGILVKNTKKTWEDGKLVEEQVLEQSVQKESVDQIVALGTKKLKPGEREVTVDGITFAAKQTIKNVTLTAYTSGFASTGKTVHSSGYGITASGTHVLEGRTIAVDPEVIPMGWWVYIEGIGFRRAEDTGSAIKGAKVDVYYNNEAYAMKFGKKYGNTIYVIGPSKPAEAE